MQEIASGIHLVRLSTAIDVSGFSYDDPELDSFLVEDALAYQQQFLANATLMMKGAMVVAYFLLVADAILLSREKRRRRRSQCRFQAFRRSK